MIDRIINWIDVEPTISLLMIITAIVLFSSALSKSKETSGAFWPWLRRLIEASVSAILFLGLLWGTRSVLNTNNTTFYRTHGSLSDLSRQSAQSIWGRPHRQIDLGYAHYTEIEVQEEIPREDPNDPPLYKNVIVRQHVPQNSVIGFRGEVNLELSERQKGYALYSGYIIDARFEYDVLNDSDYMTEAEFDFALSSGQTLFEDFMIMVDDEDISADLRFASSLVQWKTNFEPHQQRRIVVTYRSRGMDTFYYQVPNPREIKNFTLTVTIDHLPTSMVNYPDGTLTPTTVEATADGEGSVLTWELDRASTVAGKGVALPQPEQPGEQVLRVLSKSPYAQTMLIAILGLTLLIFGKPVRFLDLAMIAGAYCVEFLVMAAVSDYFFGFWGSLILGAFLTGLLTYLLFRKQLSRLLRTLIYGLVGFFTIVYPLAGLMTEVTQQNSFDGLVQTGLIIYLFGITLYTQINRTSQSQETTETA